MKLLVTLLPLVLLLIAVRQFGKAKRTAYGRDTQARNAARVTVFTLCAAAVLLAAFALLMK